MEAANAHSLHVKSKHPEQTGSKYAKHSDGHSKRRLAERRWPTYFPGMTHTDHGICKARKPEESGSIILIGMPGAGKSTIGPLLASRTGRDFFDCDALLRQQEGRNLQEIVDTDGHLALRLIEERLLLEISARRHVIATGGSAVYSDQAMRHLKTLGCVVWLRLNLDELTRRIDDFTARGLVKRPEQTLADLYAERQPLYQRHADVVVDGAGLNPEQVVENIVQALREA